MDGAIVRLTKRSEIVRLIRTREVYLIYRLFDDLGLVVTKNISDNRRKSTYKLFPDDLICMSENNTDKNEGLFLEAMRKTMRIKPPKIVNMYPFKGDDFMHWEKGYKGDYLNEYKYALSSDELTGIRLSTTDWYGGAISIFYPGVTRKLYEIFDEEYYVSFPSFNEVRIDPISHARAYSVRDSLFCYGNVRIGEDSIGAMTDKIYKYSEVEGKLREVAYGEWGQYNY